MSLNGHIKLHRSTLDSRVFANETALKIWIWCLLKASYKTQYFPMLAGKGTTTVEVGVGQFVFGRNTASKELKIKASTVYDWMKRFSSPDYEMITLKTNTHYTLVTICNWDIYQGDENQLRQQTDNKPTTNRQQTDTYKKDKKDKKDKNVIFIRPTIFEILEYCKERQNKVDADRFFNFYESKGWMVGKSKMKDWKAAIRNWEGNSKTDNSAPTKDEIKNVNSYWEK